MAAGKLPQGQSGFEPFEPAAKIGGERVRVDLLPFADIGPILDRVEVGIVDLEAFICEAHQFSRTLEDHNRAVARFQLKR